eukprot:CAMPEP_0181309686 /NCGR_PEP_ID=MMETSP1101-20121128/12149_1 /TAXON_ID=46948 /ORGANISM="Rhodomonas abbreviata, Strain Caron Lab Isolate" /LENGTH=115 /DNA_ID=CAMNT_0023416193 /DNA_START=469 /DNA_END=815 /DNA_ORIENTATION=-
MYTNPVLSNAPLWCSPAAIWITGKDHRDMIVRGVQDVLLVSVPERMKDPKPTRQNLRSVREDQRVRFSACNLRDMLSPKRFDQLWNEGILVAVVAALPMLGIAPHYQFPVLSYYC